nr:insulinase family protein [Pseudenhygromyxa sp. WMMC2535]
MTVHQHTLDNGLRVYIAENHDEPWISCRVAVRAGAAQEPAGATGLAHYLEHMLANKGSRRLGTRDPVAERKHLVRLRELYEQLRAIDPAVPGDPGAPRDPARAELLAQIDAANLTVNRWAIANELKQAYGLLGARGLNAYTSHDRTVFTVDIPANRVEAWAMLEGDRFADPVFRGFPTELETIIEERNRALDNPGRVLARAGAQRIWAGHPYARDVLGEVQDLLRPSIAETEAFFQRWYVPNNMAVILAGDLDPAATLELIRAHFGGLAPGELSAYTQPMPPLAEGEQRVDVVHRGDPEVRLLWRTVARTHEDAEALMLADMMLSNSATGLLDTRLEQRQAVRAAGSFPGMRYQGGCQTVWGRPRIDQSLEQVEALLREQVAALRAGDFRTDDLEALIANFEVGELRRLENTAAQASLLLDTWFHDWDWSWVCARLDRLAAIDRDQLVEAAQRWLGEDMVVARRTAGEPEVEQIPVFGLSELRLDSDSHSPLFRAVTSLPSTELDVQILSRGEHFEVEQTPAGLLYRSPNPSNDLFHLTFRRYVGSAHDPALAKGLDLWRRAGVGALDLEGYRRTLFHAAAATSLDCRRQQTDLSLAGRAKVLGEVLPLVVDRLRSPVIGEDERQRWAEEVVGKRQQRRDTTDFKFNCLKQWALRGEDSPYLREALTNDAVLALELPALRRSTDALLGYEQVCFYAGPHPRDELVELLGLGLPTDGSPSAPALPAPAYQPTRYVAHSGTRLFLLHQEAAQTRVGVYLPSAAYDPARSAVYRLFHEYVGGQAGLIFQEVREARGLAYSAHGGHSAGARLGDHNLIWATAASRPERAAETAAVLLGLLRELPAHERRFERARGSAIEKLVGSRVRFRGYGFTAEDWRLRGLDEDPRPRVLAELRHLGLADLLHFAEPLEQAGAAVVLVGDTTAMDMAALAGLGELERRELDELVAY